MDLSNAASPKQCRPSRASSNQPPILVPYPTAEHKVIMPQSPPYTHPPYGITVPVSQSHQPPQLSFHPYLAHAGACPTALQPKTPHLTHHQPGSRPRFHVDQTSQHRNTASPGQSTMHAPLQTPTLPHVRNFSPPALVAPASDILSCQSPSQQPRHPLTSQIAGPSPYQQHVRGSPAISHATGASRHVPTVSTFIGCPISQIQRPQFARPVTPFQPHVLVPRPQPLPSPSEITFARIKNATYSFNGAATNDAALYHLYGLVREPNDENVTIMLRLYLQQGEVEHRIRQPDHDRKWDELVQNTHDMIQWMHRHDKAIKTRAARYIIAKLSKSGPLQFNSSLDILRGLVARLYHFEDKAFFNPPQALEPKRSEYRIRVVTYLDWEGGCPKIYREFNVPKTEGWIVVKDMLRELTKNIQSAQLGHPHGFDCGGTRSQWIYYAGNDFGRTLSSAAEYQEMKRFLKQGVAVELVHSLQINVWDQLELADTLNLDLDRLGHLPLQPLPSGYKPEITDTYPNHMAEPLFRSAIRAAVDPGLKNVCKRGRRSEAGRLRERARVRQYAGVKKVRKSKNARKGKK